MANIANHPGAFLNDNAAAGFERLEAARGRTISVSDFGRSAAYQQELIDRWDEGGAENRPPNLYEPGRPATASPHVRNGGEAADVTNGEDRAWIKAHPEYGWSFTIPSDVVHMVYDPAQDEFFGSTTASNGGIPIITENGVIMATRAIRNNDSGEIRVYSDQVVNNKDNWGYVPDSPNFQAVLKEFYGVDIKNANGTDFGFVRKIATGQ